MSLTCGAIFFLKNASTSWNETTEEFTFLQSYSVHAYNITMLWGYSL